MATKKVSYKNLLKQAISEFDTSKTVELKGPMLDPILSWDGDGELPVYKDAASILERYYFNEDEEATVNVDDLSEAEYNEDGTEAKTSAEKNAEGTGTQQAGTSDASNIRGMEKDKEKDIAKEMEDLFTEGDDETDDDDDDDTDSDEKEMTEAIMSFFSEEEDADADTGDDAGADAGADDKDLDVDKEVAKEGVVAEKEFNDKDVPEKKEYTDEGSDVTEDIENAVIEKLIDEMEDVDEAEVMSYTGDGVKKGMEAPDEKKAKGPEEDTEGAGTEQAGTGTDAGQVPDRKDVADQMVKPKKYTEGTVEEEAGFPGGPGNDPGVGDNEESYNEENADLAEAFELFKEAIEDDDADEEDLKV